MTVKPLAWKDKPALIEVAFPAQKISIEAQSERKANAGQTLTALGSYWKGRKPLVLVRACLLGALLPATGDTEKDLEVFEMLMGLDDDAFFYRMKKLSVEDIAAWAGQLRQTILDEKGGWRVRGDERRRLLARVLVQMPYNLRLDKRSMRPEELQDDAYVRIWEKVNAHLGTEASSHVQLIDQLGTLRFGHRPRVADSFVGAGSIPFEAARIGCDVHASDLNPVGCMLTWGALNVVGADTGARSRIAQAQQRAMQAVEDEISGLRLEHDEAGSRAKAYLYCVETRCPETGWMVPLSASWVVSKNRRTVARLVPDHQQRRFRIEIVGDATDAALESAALGTVRANDMVYMLDGEERRIPIRTVRGDRRSGNINVNSLRPWEKEDILPRADDIFQERLYCVQWIESGSENVFFRGVTDEDLAREARIAEIVRENLRQWQGAGFVPDMPVERGNETARLLRERGWTYWHHLFTPRGLLYNALYSQAVRRNADELVQGALCFDICTLADRTARLCRWHIGAPRQTPGGGLPGDAVEQVFYNQALNVFWNYGLKSFHQLRQSVLATSVKSFPLPIGEKREVGTIPAASWSAEADLFITDPPYADAVSYDEITEFFIAWLRKNPPGPFKAWVWDSRRDLAIRGVGEDFRREMVKAYSAMSAHMADNGMQIVMFTHQDAKVWGDMAGIFWAAGLRVTAAWYIATETVSELKKGGYVQGTVILVARKRTEARNAYKDELVLEVRDEVKKQLETMIGLNQNARARGRSENIFEDSDLQMAGYAAALRVLTACTAIDGVDMTREALRPRAEGDRTIVDELIEFAVAIANEELVPEGLDPKVWERLVGSERFYLRMLDLEAGGLKKLDNYQNFAKAFRVGDWQPLMAAMKPNDSRLKSAREFKRSEFGDTEFGGSLLRAILYALHELEGESDPDDVMSHLRDNVKGYYSRRSDIVAIADYLAVKLQRIRQSDASTARILRDLVKGERLGA